MKQLDETIFAEVGLKDLTPAEKDRMLSYVTKTLETRVGIRLTAEATPEQLEQFTKLTDQPDDNKTLAWLEQSFPNFQTILAVELGEIKTELAAMTPEVLQARQ
jgi:hypothetical protein